jgi:hypothetical protein
MQAPSQGQCRHPRDLRICTNNLHLPVSRVPPLWLAGAETYDEGRAPVASSSLGAQRHRHRRNPRGDATLTEHSF